MNALVYVDIDQGKVSINIANFEAFRPTKKLISNLFFLKSALLIREALDNFLNSLGQILITTVKFVSNLSKIEKN